MVEQYRSRIGSYDNFLKTNDALSCFKDRFWNVMLMMLYMNAFYLPTSKQVVEQYKIWNEIVLWFTQFMYYNVYIGHCWYNVDNKKPSNILVFKVIRYHHELPCTLNSVVFELSSCWLFLQSVIMTRWVHSFGVIQIMITDPRSLTWFIKGTNESVTIEDSSVPSMHHDGSWFS